MTSPGGISSAPMLVTYPFNPTSRRARASDVSSRHLVPLVVLTNRGDFAVFSPSTTARALFSWAVRVLLSRTARFVEYAHTARHDPGCCSGSQMGSNLCLGLFSMLRRFFGVIVSMICPSLNASPCQRKWDSKSTGALVTREPTMNRRSASSSSLRLVADSIPASATTTMSAMLCRAWNCLMIGRIVRVSALLPSKQPIEREPASVDQEPDDHLWVDTAFLGIADLAQPGLPAGVGVFLLGFEVERRDVVEAQAHVAVCAG